MKQEPRSLSGEKVPAALARAGPDADLTDSSATLPGAGLEEEKRAEDVERLSSESSEEDDEVRPQSRRDPEAEGSDGAGTGSDGGDSGGGGGGGGVLGKVVSRALTRASTKSSWNPGPPPDGGLKAWTAGASPLICLFTNR